MKKKQVGSANYFASMTDMMVGILFIFIIMIAYFAFQIKEDNEKQNPLLIYIDRGEQFRQGIAEKVADDLRKNNIDAQVSPKNPGVVTLKGSGLFGVGQSKIDSLANSQEKIDYLSDVLAKVMRCLVYTAANSVVSDKCDNNPDSIYLESVYIEGHTDNQGVGLGLTLPDGSKNNLELSSKRATNTYIEMVMKNPVLESYKSPEKEQVLSVAAYGEQRPLASNDTELGRAANRRIDIRFVMWVPKSKEELSKFLQNQSIVKSSK